ncbi:MAG: emp24/gp25L/p24 family protein [Candidatus Bathyarchaeota archaeon]|nr:emp24/gp25L/p24 family protein [Candidatus Bathyarchaeota archaeon]
MKRKIVGLGVFIIVVGIVLLASSLIIVPFATTKPIEVEKSNYWLNASFIVSAGTHQARDGWISNGTKLGINFEVTSGGNLDVDFFVADETNYWKWRAGETADVYLSRSRATSLDVNWTVPYNDTWYFVWDNSFSWITAKGMTAQIKRYWIETDSREVTDYRPLIESQYAYVSIITLLVGVAVSVYGLIAKVQLPSTPAEKTIEET